jgi:hypothetical protein
MCDIPAIGRVPKQTRFKKATRPTQFSEPAISIQTQLEDQGYVVNPKPYLASEDAIIFQDGKPKIFRRPTIADAESDSDPDIDAPLTEPADQTGYVAMDHYVTDSEQEENKPSKYASKRVRFRELNEDWESDDTNMVLRINEDIGDRDVAGPFSSSLIQHEVISEKTTDPTRGVAQDETIAGQYSPPHTIKPAGNTPLYARVEDYESSVSSSEDEDLGRVPESLGIGVDDQSDVIGPDLSKPSAGQPQNSESRARSDDDKRGSLDTQKFAKIIREEINAALKYVQPTFPKINQSYLDVETLQYYDLPYEYDRDDPRYVIVLREMNTREMEVLFEHTRRLRNRHTPSLSRSVTWENDSDSSSTSHQRSRHYLPSREQYAQGADHWDRSNHSRTIRPRRRDSTDHISIRSNVDLQVPPFLAWSTTPEGHDLRSRSEGFGNLQAGMEGDENLRIRLTLMAIKDRIYKVFGNRRGKGKVRSSSLVIYKTGTVLVEVPKSSCPERSFHEVDLGPIGAVEADGSEVIGRRFIIWQMARLHMERNILVATLEELVSLFVPKHFDHTLLQRCWGSLDSISKVCLLQK